MFAAAAVEDGDALALADFARQAYLDYAISVVKGRALPDVCDGLKPVQRRILYAMDRMGLAAGARPVKSARVVGDVLGKYHPHGDQAAYDALVRLAQDFAQRYPLIDGQGNFGSRDGDGAAAMRYTEARLTPIARLLLEEVDQGTVDFQPNYDGSTQEPRLLPARLPMLLLNGASGIAVGMATEIPAHNLREVAAACVAVLKTPAIGLDEVLELMPGPDFATAGQVISSAADIRAAYASGRGSLKVRARWSVEELARGQWQLVVHELPPGASAQRVLQEIEELTDPKPKAGKKALSAEQQQLRQTVLGVLDGVRDESGRDAAVRLVFEPRSSRTPVEELVSVLLSTTSLETSVALNLVMIGADGKPRQKSLLDVLQEWTGFRLVTVRRRSAHRLQQVLDRLHILEGRRAVLLNIDEVIRIIRESDEPRPALMQHFALSERQAEDILEIRLRQLARLEAIRIEQEIARLQEEREELRKLLDDDKALRRRVIKEIEADARQHGDERRTLLQEQSRASLELRVPDEPVTVVVSRMGWLRALKGHGIDAAGLGFKPGDALREVFACRSTDTLWVLGSDGRAYSLAVAQLPGGRGDGLPVTRFIDPPAGTTPAHYWCGAPDTALLLASSGGYGFIAPAESLGSRQRAGKTFVSLEPGETLLAPQALRWTDEAGAVRQARHAAVLDAEGRLLLFDIGELRELPRGGRGVQLMALQPGQSVAAVLALAEGDGLELSGKGRGGKERVQLLSARALQDFIGRRARRGKAAGGMQSQAMRRA
ncbi:MAG: DNA topoisomerase IV subunit A [Betaproteobacteria bacterium]|nr:DNA topoisomerase IV subunit A [Betaproteobacteria bacterium]MBU6511388.1 DNA topoisomerase IV subunit A [Betaproteobacteria bacterium]MDE1955649.1 DNA topoisomerase IV subunit A [Betaproteobacteria bacterium]MDE2153689.1 DNA topoisomerase IV subunit A [Betaproteobacteria bacterium]MDE2477885.1 DNA topoisomerase IV subunit A [Betaproteobacteria bacterium]